MADYKVDFDDWWYFDRHGMPRAARPAPARPRFRLRPLLPLWRDALRWASLVLVAAAVFAPLGFVVPELWPVVIAYLVLFPMLYGLVLLRYSWMWGFARRVVRFRTLREGNITLHYDPEIRWDVSIMLPRVRAELDELAGRFESKLRRWPVVYLFDDRHEVAAAFGPIYGGAALFSANAIVVADSPYLNAHIRHELAHLFAARWSVMAPPLLCEGVAVWAEGIDADSAAIGCLRDATMCPRALLPAAVFYSPERMHRHYMIAGSFVAFLIRRYGLPKLRRLYRWSYGTHIRSKFEYCFGVTIEEAERQWRTYLWAKVRWRDWPRESG